ncbi:unnamed protein product [Mytilus edulis]|uniref:Uncharacterized protein n=1 Tax=Mytilus edulis TaxID=6550 RepID=A0A8S3PS22_MYTED|nr:unnamed protein product [Mytilus edulis]
MVTDFETVKMTGSVNNAKLPGHKQADCPSFEAQNKESNSMPQEMSQKAAALSQSDTDSDESNTESIHDYTRRKHACSSFKISNKSQSEKVIKCTGKASKKITKETFSFENKNRYFWRKWKTPKEKKKNNKTKEKIRRRFSQLKIKHSDNNVSIWRGNTRLSQ